MTSNPDTTAALAPPANVVSNFVDPPSIQPAIIGGLTVCLAVSTLSALLRCYAQFTLFKRLVWADAWMLLGWVFHVGFAGFLYACLPYGAGRHLWDVTETNFSRIQFLLFVDFVLYDIAILGPKISILLQLKDIFAPRGRGTGTAAQRFFWLCVALMAINIGFYIALSFALIFQCNPVAKGWNSKLQGTCLDQDSLLESSGPFNIVSDFLIFLLPISAIWQLQMPIKTRVGVGSAFAVGLFGCICSAVRLYYSNQLDSSGDATLLIFQNQLWASAEIAAAILIANIIIVPRFIRHKRGISSDYEKYYGGATRYGASRRSFGPQTTNKHASRLPARDSFMKLDETTSTRPSELHGQHLAELGSDGDVELYEHRRDGSDTTLGIMRTVEINMSEEIRSPEHAAVKNHNLDFDAEAGKTRLYDY